jgi:hypothetical protein
MNGEEVGRMKLSFWHKVTRVLHELEAASLASASGFWLFSEMISLYKKGKDKKGDKGNRLMMRFIVFLSEC